MNTTHLPVHREPTLRVIPMPRDTNTVGDIFGGWLMAQVDLAASVAAARRAAGRVATVAVNGLSFKVPVFVGDLVSVYAEVSAVGTTSMTIEVEVYAERGWRDRTHYGQIVKVTEATVIYVALDDDGHPRPVPPRKKA